MEIELTQGKATQIDDADWPLVSGYRWYAVECNGKFYAQTKEPGTNRPLYLHRFLTGVSPEQEADHESGDSLDNRRSNLRVTNATGNNRNIAKRGGLSSQYKGVHWHKAMGKWQAKIKVEGKCVHLGYFADDIAAAAAYDRASIVHHGAFGRRNLAA